MTGNGQKSFTYDAGGRLADVAGLGSYSVNGLGQRVRKSAGGLTTLFAFDEGGRLAGEYGGSGNAIQETVWLDDVPLAVLKPGGTYYIHTDHLNTPRQIHDAIGQAVWAWDAGTFGTNPPNENLAAGTFTYNLRYPGQYYDSETGLHYNYFRDYDPKTGRYIQSDPIGLAGGINTYSYVSGNPLRYTDPIGAFYVLPGLLGALLTGQGTAFIGRSAVIVGTSIWMANNLPPGFWPGDKGSAEWGRRNDVGAREGKGRFHGIKQGCSGSKATDNFGVNPDTGDVIDPAGDIVGNLWDVKAK